MFGGQGQEHRGTFGRDPPAIPSTTTTTSTFVAPLVTPATTSAFVAPSAPSATPVTTSAFVAPPDRGSESATTSVRDDEASRDHSDASPVFKRARLYTENEWTRDWLRRRETNFARQPVRILGRRYPLTKTSYKYIDVSVVVRRESCVAITLGDCHGREIALTPDIWRDLLDLRGDITRYFETYSDDANSTVCVTIGSVTLRFGRINMKTLRFDSGKTRISMTETTVRALFDFDLCINHLATTLNGLLGTVETVAPPGRRVGGRQPRRYPGGDPPTRAIQRERSDRLRVARSDLRSLQ